MTVLIVTKTTNYELHGPSIEAKLARGGVPSDAVERLKVAHKEHHETVTALRDALRRSGTPFVEVGRDQPRAMEHDIVVTVGGDGTLLAASHQMTHGGRIFGLRSSYSSVGYLCCAGPKDVERLVHGIQHGTSKAVKVPRLLAEIFRIETGETIQSVPILNDFLYANVNPAATTRYKVTFGGKSEIHRSSGIWIATGVGSTAAIFAAGGEQRPLDDAQAQFRVRELYRLGHEAPTIDGGLFDPSVETLMIENRCPQAILALDGQHGSLELAYGDRITFKWAPPVELVRQLENIDGTH